MKRKSDFQDGAFFGLALVISVLVLCAVNRCSAQSWHDVRDIAHIEGRGWAGEPGFGRLPARAAKVVRPVVWQLADCTAGVCARFITDATEISARWTLTSSRLALPDMPAVACSGLDLYVRHEGRWRWVGVGRPTGRKNEQVIVRGMDRGEREYLLYFPLFNGVQSLELSADSPIRPAASRGLPVVFYGTSITQGRGASRPGTCHVARLGRMLDREVINLGFAGHGEMEPEIGPLLAEIQAAAVVVDCLPNTKEGQRSVQLVERLGEIPVLLAEDRTYGDAFLRQERRDWNTQGRAALRQACEDLRAAGRPTFYLPGGALLGEDETVDGSHPSDAGYASMARAFLPVLQEMLVTN